MDMAEGRMPERSLVEADFTRRRALILPEAARYDVLLEMPKDGNLGAGVTAAMEAVEDHFPPLAGQLPKDYERHCQTNWIGYTEPSVEDP